MLSTPNSQLSSLSLSYKVEKDFIFLPFFFFIIISNIRRKQMTNENGNFTRSKSHKIVENIFHRIRLVECLIRRIFLSTEYLNISKRANLSLTQLKNDDVDSTTSKWEKNPLNLSYKGAEMETKLKFLTKKMCVCDTRCKRKFLF